MEAMSASKTPTALSPWLRVNDIRDLPKGVALLAVELITVF